MTLALGFQLLASIATLIAIWQMGNRSVNGPLFGLIAEATWAGLVITNELWGIAPVVVVAFLIHARNLRKWTHAARPLSVG
jgi:nicotinamide riboside transporter PnuC